MAMSSSIRKNKSESGVTLVELAIVLVLIGLIISAIAAGSSLIQQSKVKAVIGEMGEYLSAIEAFRSKYSYRPGDLESADRYFTGNAVDADANGNDRWDRADERNIAWAQLNQAEMIKQAFPDMASSDTVAVPGTNRPLSKMDGGGWTFIDSLNITPPGGGSDIWYYHILRIGANDGTTDELQTPVLTVEDHTYIDNKIDKPNSPLEGNYFVGENTCTRNVGGEYKYATDTSLMCTGNYAEISNASFFTPPP